MPAIAGMGIRLRVLIVILWRAGLRIHEALSLAETGLDERRGSVLIRHGKGDKRREVGMDAWAWSVYSDVGRGQRCGHGSPNGPGCPLARCSA
jgi:site-specific recombinase XerD